MSWWVNRNKIGRYDKEIENLIRKSRFMGEKEKEVTKLLQDIEYN